jgi:hypothetical protein
MFYLSKSKHIDFRKLHNQADSLIGLIPAIKKRRRLNKIYKIIKFFVVCFLALLLIAFILLFTQALGFKQIYDQAVSGKADLEQAIILSQQNKFTEAVISAETAEKKFDAAIFKFNQIISGQIIKKLPLITSQFNDIQSLLVTSKFLCQAVMGGANFGKSLGVLFGENKNLNFSELDLADKRLVLSKIFESAPEMNGIKANLDLASINLEQVKYSGLLLPFKEKINQVKGQIDQARQLLEKAVPLSQLLPVLAGYPKEVKYLVLLQNNDELRPTGGFIGTYGILQFKDGEISEFNTHDIYHLDMPVEKKLNIIPPEPIKKYLNNKWYLRDANWSPDWPMAAKKINWFYQIESSLNKDAEKIDKFDGLIAITPKLINDFLKITGPITIEGQTYDYINFQELLQYRVERGYMVLGVSSWQRKEIIGEIAKELKNKIFTLPPRDWYKIVSLITDNLAAKNILLYLTDSQLENMVIQNNWAGEIKQNYGDYLMVVDANLGALKTDAVMNRSLEYRVAQGVNGWFSKLTLSYAHNGRLDWKTSVYKSYTRIYVPLGSQLIKINGYLPSQVDVGNEAGKTWFGFYLEVEPDKIKNLTIEYKLPAKIFTLPFYELYIQKQPGKEINEAAVDLSFLNEIKSYSPASLYMQKTGLNEVKWIGDLNIDRSFLVNF